MLDVFKVADVLVSHAVETHSDEVDLICYHGSYAKGTATRRSDLDIFYTPAPGANPPVGRTVLVEGVLFDFWAVPWERLETCANGRNGVWSGGAGPVHYAQVLYARSDAQRARLASLKQKVHDLLQPAARASMVRRALAEFKSVLVHLGNLRLAYADGEFADVRSAGWRLVASVVECLTLANQTFLDQPGERFIEQLESLPERPSDVGALVSVIATSADADEISLAAERLARDTRAVLLRLQQSSPAQPDVAVADLLNYPEANAGLGKVLTACEQGDAVVASRAAWFAQYDMSLMLSGLRRRGDGDFNVYSEYADVYREIGLPELMGPEIGDSNALTKRVGAFDQRLRRWLTEQNVDLAEYTGIEAFERSLRMSE